MSDPTETRWCDHGARHDDNCVDCDIQERDEEIERLTAQLKATEANEQILVDANKPLLVRIAALENLLDSTVEKWRDILAEELAVRGKIASRIAQGQRERKPRP